MHGPKSFLSSISRTAVLIFDLFRVSKSKPETDRGFSFDCVPGNQNRLTVLNFDLFQLWKSKFPANSGFSLGFRERNQNPAGGGAVTT